MLKDSHSLIPLHDHGVAIGWPNILPLVWIDEERGASDLCNQQVYNTDLIQIGTVAVGKCVLIDFFPTFRRVLLVVLLIGCGAADKPKNG